ncbi:MAG: alpha-amylase family glycosyl hydrolase [Candidatus Krumholzibacteriota bacterium]|nr:alpha-amylase family glycosyl hydrolase [Candidatus Krumholzibacteriota bacterium]
MSDQVLEMGALPLEEGYLFRVWAPNADSVSVVGSFNDWNENRNQMERGEGGIWSAPVKEAETGDEYLYRIVNGENIMDRIDPYARRVSNSAGRTIVPRFDFKWKEKDFKSAPLNRMVIYEMHLGSFAVEPGGKPGSLQNAIKKLPHLKELGINAVEIMPLMEFPGGFSWGYNPSQIFALESDYGDPADFSQFVKAAHEKGIAVILDVVYNHLGPGDLDLWQFDGWEEKGMGGIYFYNDWRSGTPWGDTRPDYGRGEVRKYLCDNAIMWLRDYHVDGLRFDATSFIRNVRGRGDDQGSDLPEGWSLMQWINSEIKKFRPEAFTIAEDLGNNPSVTKDVREGGCGFDSQWDLNFVHTLRGVLKAGGDSLRDIDKIRDIIIRRYYLDSFERIIYTESHDEVANGKARMPEEVDPGNAANLYAKKISTLGAALVLTSPGIPMIFQGQEFLEDDWFHDRDPVDWSRKKKFSGIFRLYCDLVSLRLNRDGKTSGLTGHETEVFHVNNESKFLAYHRWDRGGPEDSTVVAVNMSGSEFRNYRIGLPADGLWKVRFNSDAKDYDDEFSGLDCPDVTADRNSKDGQPYGGVVNVAPYSAVILSQDRG